MTEFTEDNRLETEEKNLEKEAAQVGPKERNMVYSLKTVSVRSSEILKELGGSLIEGTRTAFTFPLGMGLGVHQVPKQNKGLQTLKALMQKSENSRILRMCIRVIMELTE